MHRLRRPWHSKDARRRHRRSHESCRMRSAALLAASVLPSTRLAPPPTIRSTTGKNVHLKAYVVSRYLRLHPAQGRYERVRGIIAVNKNDTAPIFEIADYGICGDLFKVTPMLIEAFKAAKASKQILKKEDTVRCPLFF